MSNHDAHGHNDTPSYTFKFMRFPGEIRNNIYDYILSDLYRYAMVVVLPSPAFVDALVHRELMSRIIPRFSYDVTSIPDIWYFNMLLDVHPEDTVLRKITKLTIKDFTSIADSQSRAGEVMDFLHQFPYLEILELDIVLDDLFHGFQGRLKDVETVCFEYELFKVCELSRLTKLVIRVKHNSIPLSPRIVSLLVELEDKFIDKLSGAVVFLHVE